MNGNATMDNSKETLCVQMKKHINHVKLWQEIKCYFCILVHILSNIESILIK